MDNQTQQHYYSSSQAVLCQALDQGLSNNESQLKIWREYKAAHEKVKEGLRTLPEELTTNCMVPIGRKALMKGKLVHTNEILVCLGAQYLAKYSAKQAIAVCDRRMKQADEMLSSLKKEKDLLEMRRSMPTDYGVFGDNERQEIVEPYIEEEEHQWRIMHRQHEKEYRQKLAELRAQEKTEIRSEEDLWQRLDELELQEELEDEIDRLQSGDHNYYGNDARDDDNSYEEDDDNSEFTEDETMIDRLQEGLVKLKNSRESEQENNFSQSKISDKESDYKPSLTSDVDDNPQPSTSGNSNKSMVQLKSIAQRNDGTKSEIFPSFSNNENSANDKEATMHSHTFVNSNETQSANLTGVKKADSNKNCNQSEIEVQKSVKFKFQSREDANEQLVSYAAKKYEQSNNNERLAKSETSKRHVSFTDKIQVNVFEKSGDHIPDDDVEQKGKCSGKSDVEYNKLNSPLNDENSEDFTDPGDEQDIIRIVVKHSVRKPRTQIKSNGKDVIEDPSDIYRVFCRPKSILKKSSGDMGDYQNFVPVTEDIFDRKTEDSSAESSYNIIIRDVEERNPDVLQAVNLSSKGRPLSRFKMARSGMK